MNAEICAMNFAMYHVLDPLCVTPYGSSCEDLTARSKVSGCVRLVNQDAWSHDHVAVIGSERYICVEGSPLDV